VANPDAFPVRVETGRVSYVDGTTVVYVPFRDTIEDVRGALLHLHAHGLTRPVPGTVSERERVWPIEYFPTDDRRIWQVWFRNDRAELIEAMLHIRSACERATPGPWDDSNPAVNLDTFRVQ
jgi:hypothetical protein